MPKFLAKNGEMKQRVSGGIVSSLPFTSAGAELRQGEKLGMYALRCRLGMFEPANADMALPVYRSRVERILSYAKPYDSDYLEATIPTNFLFYPLDPYDYNEVPILRVSPEGALIVVEGPKGMILEKSVRCLVRKE